MAELEKEVYTMSNRQIAHELIDQIPESKLLYVVSYLQGAAVPEETPNDETLAAMEEVQQLIDSGTGEHFSGSTSDFFASILED
jgi:hypothetical protein